MLVQMQSLEEMRLHSLNAALSDFAKLQSTFTAEMLSISRAVSSLANNMNANADLDKFVSSVCLEHGPALPPVPFSYDLPISLAELKAMTFDEPPSSLFYSTLEGVMRHQKAQESVLGTTANMVAGEGVASAGAIGGISAGGADTPSSTHPELQLPLIVPTLLRNIYETDGMRSEGIFRISVGSEELTRVRRQFESGDFHLRLATPNPHVSACLLKSWFRDLLQPIIPFALYERAIVIGQTADWSPLTNPAQMAMMRGVLSELPSLNGKILALLLGFLKRLSSVPEYVSRTRMNLANLALVFSPGLLRSEKNDPLQMLQDTKYASHFVFRAVEASPECFTQEAQQCAEQLLEHIFSGNVTHSVDA